VAPVAPKAPATASAPAHVDPVVLTNQMMLTIMERMKIGAYDEARKIALDMILGHDKIKDSPQVEHKSFATLMGKKLYERMAKQEGRSVKVEWAFQPIADGFYFLAMIDFHQRKAKEALDNLQKAIFWDPTRSAFHAERAYIQLNSGLPVEMAFIMASYLKALELADNFDDFAAALRGIGYLLVDKRDLETALAAYTLAKHYDPQNKVAPKEIEFIKAEAPGIGKDMDVGKAAVILAKKGMPTSVGRVHIEVLLEIAREMTDPAQQKERQAILRRALKLDPKNEEIRRLLGGR